MVLYSVTKPDELSDPSYHPDGSRVIFVQKTGSTYSIATITNGATPEHTTLISGSLQYADPYYSSDGNYILYAVQMSGVTMDAPYGIWSLFYMYADGTNPTVILDDGNANMHPCWVTPIQIGFQYWIYGESTVFRIALMDLAGQGRVNLGEGSYPRTVTA